MTKPTYDEIVEALSELIEAEWMVTPDWSGSKDRDALIEKARRIVARARGWRA